MTSTRQRYVQDLRAAKDYFDRSSACLTEEDGAFRPHEDLMTTAQHVAHVAQTVDWFVEGAFGPEGFDMDFEKLMAQVTRVESLAAARRWLDDSFEKACAAIESASDSDLDELMPEHSVLGAVPRNVIVGGIQDHTAHHRGALTVYSRLCGRAPAMPYPL